ncbi:hypothetical protein NF212_23590 [Parasalinivibrio latis]|uniref:hypothetical protein n=1 Tax=Parasalinivibrio latis TaxID=2952610 RepID=UPI0030E2C1E5
MPKIIPFPRITDSPQQDVPANFLADEIKEELAALTSDPYLIDSVLAKMTPLLEIINEEPEAIFEMSEEGCGLKDQIEQVQVLQMQFNELITKVLSERILREMEFYHSSDNCHHSRN